MPRRKIPDPHGRGYGVGERHVGTAATIPTAVSTAAAVGGGAATISNHTRPLEHPRLQRSAQSYSRCGSGPRKLSHTRAEKQWGAAAVGRLSADKFQGKRDLL